jgi:nucleoside-diphosphate-sugar epimerase
MRILFVGGTGPVGQAAIAHLGGHDVAVAHSGVHEAVPHVEHLHGSREELLAPGGPVDGWRPDTVVDTFPGGATAAKAHQLGALAHRAGVGHLIVTSSIDVYRHAALAGVDGFEPAELPLDTLPLTEEHPRRPPDDRDHDNVSMGDGLAGAPRLTILRPGAIYGPHDHAHLTREWYLVGKVVRGERALTLPHGGTQLFHRVALDRVGRAVANAIDHAPQGMWACNVGDPSDLTFGGLAQLVATEFGHEWELSESRLQQHWLREHGPRLRTRR